MREAQTAAAGHDLTVVVPTLNEADNVGALVEQLAFRLGDIRAEILFVDDSGDATARIISETAATALIPVRLIHRDRPVGGLAGAVVAGIAAAGSPWVVVMDGDLQHPPADVRAVYRRALAGDSDIVVASRYIGPGRPDGLANGFRRLVSVGSGRAVKLLFPRRLAGCSDPMSGFFAVRPEALRLEAVTQCGYKVLLSLLLHRRLSVAEVPFVFAERHAGHSKASIREGLRFVWLLALLRVQPAVRSAPTLPAGGRGPSAAPARPLEVGTGRLREVPS